MNCTSHIYLPNGFPDGNPEEKYKSLGTGAYYDIESKLQRIFQDSLRNVFIIGVMDCCREEIPEVLNLKKGTFVNKYVAPKHGSICMIYAARPGDPAYVSANMTLKLINQIECCLE